MTLALPTGAGLPAGSAAPGTGAATSEPHTGPRAVRARRLQRRVSAVIWAASVTLVMQIWVGNGTIYRDDVAPRVRAMHQAVLDNRPPAGASWSAAGASSDNVRVVTVFAAEAVRRMTGRDVASTYRIFDTVGLFVGLLLLVVFLRGTAPEPYALIGALGFASLLPLTYQLFYFHPWDRPSLVSWLALLILLQRRRLGLFALLLPLAVAIKFDVVLLPALVFLLELAPPFDRARVGRAIAIGAALACLSFATLLVLRLLRPGGFDDLDTLSQLARNLRALRGLGLGYPPALGFALPFFLAAIGLRRADRFARSCALFGALLMIPFALRSNVAEFRAEVPVLLLVLPAALAGVRVLCEGDGERDGAEDDVRRSLASPTVVG